MNVTNEILKTLDAPDAFAFARHQLSACNILERCFVRALDLIRVPGNEKLDGSRVVQYYFDEMYGAYRRIVHKAMFDARAIRGKKKKYRKLGPKPSNNKKIRHAPFIARDSQTGLKLSSAVRMSEKELKKNGLGRFANVGISCQSGKKLPVQKQASREEREELQRQAARERSEKERKSVPKEERMRKIKDGRDKRLGVMIDHQSGRLIATSAALGGVAVGFALNKIGNALQGAVKTGNDFFQMFKDFKESIKRVAKKTLWLVPFVMATYFLYLKTRSNGILTLACVSLAMAKLLPKKLWNIISPFFNEEKVVLQSASSAMAKLLSTVLCFSIFKDKVKPGTVSELMKRVALLERSSNGWEAFIKWVVSGTEVCLNALRKMFGKQRIDLCDQSEKPIRAWAIEIDKVTHKINVCDGEFDNTVINKIVELYTHGHTLKNLVRGSPQETLVNKYLLHLEHLLQPFAGSLNAQYNFRVQPECAIFTGAPGIGKTVLTLYICAAVLKRSGLLNQNASQSEFMSNVWQRCAGPFWNSYAGQHCMIIDDIFQWKGDPTDAENQFMTLIKAVSSWSYPLEFADVASKGKNFFSSKFILGTCNTVSIDAMARNFVHEPEAVTRRIDHPYKMVLNAEFADANGRLDYTKFQRAMSIAADSGSGMERFPWHIWTLYKHDFLTGVTSSVPVSLKEVVENISVSLKNKLTSHHKDKEAVMDFFSGIESASSPEILPQAGVFYKVPLPREYADGEENYFCFFDEACPEARAKAYNLETLSWWQNFKCQWKMWRRDFLKADLLISCFFGVMSMAIVVAIYIAAIRTGLTIARNLFATIFGRKNMGDDDNIEVQSNRPSTKAKKGKPSSVVPQSGQMQIMMNALDNTYKLIIESEDGRLPLGQLIFVNDRLAVCPAHFTNFALRKHLEDGVVKLDDKVLFVHATQGDYKFSLSVSKFLALKRHTLTDMDVDFVVVDGHRAHRNIENYFLTEKQLRYVGGERCRFDVVKVGVSRPVLEKPTQHMTILERVEYGENLHFNGRKLDRYFKYRNLSEYGDCGASLAIFDNSSYSAHTIFGIHVAFNAVHTLGYCAVVTTEMIAQARTALKTLDDKFMQDLQSREIECQSGDVLPFETAGSFLPIGILSRSINLAPRSSYFPTELYGIFGEYDSKPAALRPVFRDEKLVYPMLNAVKPYSSPVIDYDDEDFDFIAHVAYRKLTELTNRTHVKRIFTFEEAVKGIPELKFRSIPRQTAAGFPYCYTVSSGKTEFFGEGQEYDLDNDMALRLRCRVEHILSSARKGERLAVVYNDFLKDELRSAEKVEAVATRLISSAPLDYVIAWRMYFGDFSAYFMRNNIDTGMAPGICCYTDWGKLAEHLSSKGANVFAGDFKGFDASEQPCVFKYILKYINEWYDDGAENALVREVLWADLEHSRHLGGDGTNQRYLYQWNKSLPSGHPFTTIVNSMYSLFLLTACYIKLTGDWIGFWNNISPITYGDDNVVNVAVEFTGVYNQTTVAHAMSKFFQVIYTSDDKTADLSTVKTLRDVSFLKRRFFLDENFWNCPLELDSFLYCSYWCKNKRLKNKIIMDELENCLEELSLHPSSVWDKYAAVVYNELRMFKVPNAPCERKEYLKIVRSRADDWY